MGSNKYYVEVKFESNSKYKRKSPKYSGRVVYEFINHELNYQQWEVTESDKEEMKGKYNSISKIVSTYRKSAITGACSTKENSAVVNSEDSMFKFFYSVLPAGGNPSVCALNVQKQKNQNYDILDKEAISLEEAVSSKGNVKLLEKLRYYNGVQ